jgi:GTP-binding protein
MIPIPKIALVGRPNVGKSTLFNRICGMRKAITDSRAGSTRDRNYVQVTREGFAFELVDTGGLLLGSDDPLLGPAVEQARTAILEADLVVFVVDARAGLLPADEEIARQLRRDGKSVLVAVNKVEGERVDAMGEFPRLGFDSLMAISAEHALGVGDLLDEVQARVPQVETPRVSDSGALPVAFVGRPNVGKSSIINTLLGDERSVVSAVPGTTRDAVDSELVRGEQRYRIVDTAGIRRVRLLKESVDHVSVIQARRNLERADIAVLVMDSAVGVREMDATIGGYAHESSRGVVIAMNKWDLVQGRKQAELELEARDNLKFLAYAPIVFTSTVTGKGFERLFAAIDRVAASQRTRVPTSQLNAMMTRALQEHPLKLARGGRRVRLLYASQIGILPPTFVLSFSQEAELHFSYRRYLENQLRAAFGFEGSPIIIRTRVRRH